MAGIWLVAAPVAVECAQFRPRATVRLVATGSTIANHPAGRLTADELANLIESPTAGRLATPVILAKRPTGCLPAGRRLVQACFIPRPGDPSRGAGATSRPTAAANMLQKMNR